MGCRRRAGRHLMLAHLRNDDAVLVIDQTGDVKEDRSC
jgi:hypothetical protein